MPQMTEAQLKVAYGTAMALAVMTSSRSDAAGSQGAVASVLMFQTYWNLGQLRPFVDSELRARGFVPVIPDQLVKDGAYGGNTARALVATLWAFDRNQTRAGTVWAQDMVTVKTFPLLARLADTAGSTLMASNGFRDSAGSEIISAAAADIYRIEKLSAPAAVVSSVQARLLQLASALGPWSPSSAVTQASSAGSTAVSSAQQQVFAPSSAQTDANATVATARVEGAAAVNAAQNGQTILQPVIPLEEMDVIGNRTPSGRSIPTPVWVAGGALLLFGIGYGAMKLSEKHA